MATAVAQRRHGTAPGSYRKLVVPLVGGPDSARAVEIACSLAAEQGAELTVVYVIEVPTALPLDARMDEDEATARTAFHQAEAIADSFGVRLRGRKVRARDAGPAIVELADELGAEVVVLAAPRKHHTFGRSRFGATVRHVLAKARCPVLVAALPF
jgi:nucleotide-binding universal stress UspA family protein